MTNNELLYELIMISFIFLYTVCGLGIASYTTINKHLPETRFEFKECLYYGLLSIPTIILSFILISIGLFMFALFFISLIIIGPLAYLLERFYSFIFDKIIYKI